MFLEVLDWALFGLGGLSQSTLGPSLWGKVVQDGESGGGFPWAERRLIVTL